MRDHEPKWDRKRYEKERIPSKLKTLGVRSARHGFSALPKHAGPGSTSPLSGAPRPSRHPSAQAPAALGNPSARSSAALQHPSACSAHGSD